MKNVLNQWVWFRYWSKREDLLSQNALERDRVELEFYRVEGLAERERWRQLGGGKEGFAVRDHTVKAFFSWATVTCGWFISMTWYMFIECVMRDLNRYCRRGSSLGDRACDQNGPNPNPIRLIESTSSIRHFFLCIFLPTIVFELFIYIIIVNLFIEIRLITWTLFKIQRDKILI